ncbi:hypothetical protein PVAND_002444 [Polypedilum vanderplanki]|uniref:RRM domain-containing protein n=1 Tax=Polypedilum vanderplanki TaxID=319348 RepID=A0A9J6BSJ6_POLVA|nr:hypothetical protein PVAND_002444 [Polypedilum vanderplanki]
MDSNEDYIKIEQSSRKVDNITKKAKFRRKIENIKKGRIIVRNLSFKVTEELLREEFEKYGEISEVNILKKPDGKLVGCAFLQYFNYNDSTKAIKAMNGKDFLKRKITVDFAVSKNRYKNAHKSEFDDSIKDNLDTVEMKEEQETKIEKENKAKSEHSNGEEEEENDDNNSNITDDDKKIESEVKEKKSDIKKEKKYNEKDNEYTVFVKNLNFDTTNEDLHECFKKFGPIKYALIVKDSISGHSKGTAFVKFLRKESVEICLAQSGKINLQDFVLEVLPTLSKQTVKNIEKQKEITKKEPKDSRNLYLIREGMIAAGSTASEGVSATDMAKRLRLEQIKSSMLKNLTRFISRERLTIHNLPENYDDAKLRKMVESRTKIKPIECRVMRENKPSALHPNGKSKGFGFLSFKKHEDALLVLRKLNNNPEVFSAKHRPIVSFSIEDMNVLKIKEKRKQRSMLNNPTYQKKLEKLKVKKLKKQMEKKDNKSNTLIMKKKQRKVKSDEHVELYTGFASKPGAFVKLRGTFKLKEQSRIHEKTMKERNKKVRREKQLAEVRQEKQEKKFDRISNKRKIKDTNDTLASKINKYKSLIGANEEADSKRQKIGARGKWFMD